MPSTPQDAAPGVRRAFLIADIRGYSTFTRERGDAAAARLATKFADLARDSIEARGGSVIELRGDEALAVFVSSGQAVRAGLEFQEGCREATDEDPELPLPVGIGIAVGEAVPVEDGFRGAALNLAARLCSKAVAGQVLVTEAVLAESSSVPHLVFEPLDAVELKGFDRPVELFEARSTEGTPLGTAAGNADADGMPGGLLPRELDDPAPLVGRDHELRWLRGTWRRARRGHGRLVFVSGPPGIGKTRLAAELAAFVLGSGGEVRLAGAGGDALARALGEIGRASSATAASLVILDEVDVLAEVAERLDEVAPTIANRPVLILGLFRDADRNERLAGLVAREDADGDGHRVLGPLGAEDAHAMAVAALGDVGLEEFPAEAIARSSGGVPARMQEAIGDWARGEAARRLAAAAEWMTEGRTRQSAGLDFAANLIARNLGRIYGSPPATTEASAVEPECPYRGLAAFGEDDAPLYFGRERLVGEVAARTVGAGLLAVVGPSGSGKSSLVMAGLLPSLAAGLLPGSARWGHVVLRPGDHPMDALQTALLQKSPGTRLVLVVDQFEETFTTAADEDERGAFVDRLVELAGDPEGSVVVLTIRADYTGHCAPYPELARLLAANLVLVGPMTPDETRRAIELPARRAGVRVESALAEALVEEVGEEPGALPLLSTALVELWHARDGAWMRLEARGRTGGIRGAVARLAESSYDELTEPERDTARAVFLRLVGQGEGDAAVRRQVAVTEFDIERDPTLQRVLDRLTDDRLLTRDDGRIEIAHEALIREWPRLRTWLEEDATGRALRTHLTQSARQWDERDRDRDSGDLYRGARLSATLDWAQDHDRELNAVEREFLAQGRQAGDAEAERQRRTNRRLRGLLVGTAVFLIVALVAGGLALVQRGHARTAQAAAESQALTSDAERVGTLARTEPSLDRSFLLGVAGVRLEDVPETRGDLLAVLQDAPGVVRFLQASPSGVPAFAASPDGRLLATGDSAGIVRFHDLATSRLAGPTVDVGGPVSLHAMAFSPDGRTVAVGTTTGLRANVVMVDVAGRSARQFGSWPSVPASAGPIRFLRMAFAPDGAHVAVAVATSKPPLPVAVGQRLLLLDLQGHVVWDRDVPVDPGQNETQVEFLPDGAIVTSAQQGETRLWDPATGTVTRTFAGAGGPFAVSPDGTLAAIGVDSPDAFNQTASLQVLDLRTGRQTLVGDLPAAAWITSVAFAHDGRRVAVRSVDGPVRVWDVDTRELVQTSTAQPSGLSVAMIPGTNVALSDSQEGTIAGTDVGGADRLGLTFRWRGEQEGCAITPCLVIDRSGGLMAESLTRGRTALVDLRSRRRVATLPPMNGNDASALAFSPDGATLVTGGVDGTVTLWNVANRTPTNTLRIGDRVWWVAVSPDGRLLATQSEPDGASTSTVEVRTLEGGRIVFRGEVRDGKGGLSFSPDGRSLAALGCCVPGSTVVVWDTRTWEERYRPTVAGHADSLAFSPDGRFLGIGTEDGSVLLLDAGTGRPNGATIQAATGPINPLSFSPDGRLLVASSGDQTSTLWDVASRRRIGTTFPIEEAAIPVAVFTPAGDVLIDYLRDTSIWPTSLRRWEDFACGVAGRDLSPQEWNEILPDRPYRAVCPS